MILEPKINLFDEAYLINCNIIDSLAKRASIVGLLLSIRGLTVVSSKSNLIYPETDVTKKSYCPPLMIAFPSPMVAHYR